MIDGVFEAILKLGLPVAGLSFAMVWWALRRGVLSELDGVHALGVQIAALGKKKDKNKKREKINPVHDKWLKFGGGYYGIVALYTWCLIEYQDIADTVSRFGGFSGLLDRLGINLLINMFIEGLMNFIAAIAWPVYWMSEFGANRIWLWMAIAYGGYWLGIHAAQRWVRSKR
jgi:hypothetical protein